MVVEKIKYKLKKIYDFLKRKYLTFSFDWNSVILSTICILFIIILVSNIFKVLRKGYDRYQIIISEKKRLEALLEENSKLKSDLEYYSSTEYVALKAREELNMVFPNQKIVYIEKSFEINRDIVKKEKERKVKPSWKNWYDLIFE